MKQHQKATVEGQEPTPNDVHKATLILNTQS